MYEVRPLTHEYLDELVKDARAHDLHRAYYTEGSVALCLVEDERPVFAGGLVNLQWNRAEAWILPTPFFKTHVRLCLRYLRNFIPTMAETHGFTRIQATCVQGVSATLFEHLGFKYEGTMRKYGPNGETCTLYSRIMGAA